MWCQFTPRFALALELKEHDGSSKWNLMVRLIATRKVLERLATTPTREPGDSGTALGDWYVNRVVVNRHPLLVLVSSASLLPIVEPARHVQQLPSRLPTLVEGRLHRLGVMQQLIQTEVSAMDPVLVDKTSDRSVLGILTEFCRMLPYYLPQGQWSSEELARVADRLGETPCHAGRRNSVWPNQRANELLWRHWSSILALDRTLPK